MIRALSFVLVALLTLPVPARAVELVMVEQPGCYYCERWHDEIAEIYPKTEAGKFAPLRLAQLRAPAPDGYEYARKVVYTPTFIVIEDGREIARIEGYPGEDFFWFVLEKTLAENTEFEGGTSCATC